MNFETSQEEASVMHAGFFLTWQLVLICAYHVTQKDAGRIVGMIHALVQIGLLYYGMSETACHIGLAYFMVEFLYSVMTRDLIGLVHSVVCSLTFWVITSYPTDRLFSLGYYLLSMELSTPMYHMAYFMRKHGNMKLAVQLFRVFAIFFFVVRVVMLPIHMYEYVNDIGYPMIFGIGGPFYALQIYWMRLIAKKLVE